MSSERQKRAPLGMRIIVRVGIVLGAVVLVIACLLGWFTAVEYRPADVEALAVEVEAAGALQPGDELTIMTWNIGYGALGDNADFFMDGGSGVYTAEEGRVRENIGAVIDRLGTEAPDVVFLQETDRDSSRSYHIDEARED